MVQTSMLAKLGVAENLSAILQGILVLLALITPLHTGKHTKFRQACHPTLAAPQSRLTTTFLKIAFSFWGSFWPVAEAITRVYLQYNCNGPTTCKSCNCRGDAYE